MSKRPRHFNDQEIGEARRRRHRARRIPAWVYRTAAILLAASLGLALWFNRDGLSPENIASWVRENVVGSGTGDGYPVTIGGSQIYARNFRSQNGDAVFVSDTRLTVLNNTGAEKISRQHSFDFPILCLSGDRALIYNLGGKGYQLESSRETVLRGTTEENILGGAIASNGHYALLTECADYLGQLTVYTEQNEKQFEYRFSSCYPVAAALNADATKAFVGGVYAQDGGLVSCLYLLDLNSSEAVSPAGSFAENVPLDAFFYSDGSAALVGDALTAVVNASGAVSGYEYGGSTLCAYAGGDGYTALCLSSYEGASGGRLVLLGPDGREERSFDVSGEPKAVSLYGNTAAVLAGGTVYAYSIADGALFAQADAGADALSLALADESSAYLLGVSEIRTVSLNG